MGRKFNGISTRASHDRSLEVRTKERQRYVPEYSEDKALHFRITHEANIYENLHQGIRIVQQIY